ncbi:hypothetical protein NEMIN01_1566 [Nematocida minor]|uniref:uncharacterized protein n=1 Tax=Nematocida minor TaxID=1912983 RepID=UPI002220F4C7|nr:uncharacterized protein NEMIN01_1566 [Nematocida minor]KAI5191540.1 hypothetical protein NEMIN01_1566 [Nematocida minor]
MNAIIAAYMMKKMSIYEVIEKYEGDKESGKIVAYILYETLRISSESELELHKKALEKYFKKEYIPGLFSEYIKIAVDQKMSRLHEGIEELIGWCLERVCSLEEVPGLEERLILFLKGNREKRDRGSIQSIIRQAMKKGSKEGKEHFTRIILENKCSSLYGLVDSRRVVADVIVKVYEEHRIAEGIKKNREILQGVAEYNVNLLLPIIRRSIAEVQEDAGCTQREYDEERVEDKNGLILRADAEKVLNKIQISSKGREKERRIVVEWLREIRKIVDKKTKKTSTDLVEIGQEKRIDNNIINTSNLLVGENVSDLLSECIHSINSQSVFLIAEVCEESRISIPAGCDLSRAVLLRVLEATGDKEYINSHPISRMINIAEEISAKYDYYLSLIFKNKSNLSISLNIINAIVEYGYHGRIAGLTVELSNLLKKMEYVNRNRFILSRSQEIEYIPKIIKKIVEKTHFKKKDLKMIFKSVVYLITTDNTSLVKEIYPVLESIIYAYKELDEGVPEYMYGMRKAETKTLHNRMQSIADKNDKNNENSLSQTKYGEEEAADDDPNRVPMSDKDNNSNNVMVVSAEVFEIMNGSGFDYSMRSEIVSLLAVMLATTGDFLIARIEKYLLPDIVHYYTKNSSIVNSSESKALVFFVSEISKHPLKTTNYLSLVHLLLILTERNIEGSEGILKALYTADKYALVYAIHHFTKKQNRKTRAGLSIRAREKIQKIFTENDQTK